MRTRSKGLVALAIVACFALPAAAAVSDSDFIIDDLDDLVRVCTVPDSDPMHTAAINFCQGFLVGAYHTGAALRPPGKRPLVCLPDPMPTRTQAIANFMTWAKAHPQYGKEEAVNAYFKFLIERWPCRS